MTCKYLAAASFLCYQCPVSMIITRPACKEAINSLINRINVIAAVVCINQALRWGRREAKEKSLTRRREKAQPRPTVGISTRGYLSRSKLPSTVNSEVRCQQNQTREHHLNNEVLLLGLNIVI